MSLGRQEKFAALAAGPFDLLIIGGGITGAGIARDAALRGLKVALVEKGDYASGTSSKSSKLVHGGLRYLENYEFALVGESVLERALLMKLAPHLVRPLKFLVPSYTGDKPNLFVLDVGLWIYDALSRFSSPSIHRTYRKRKILTIEPALRSEQLKGGIVYYDCMTDDARMTLENIIDAEALGAVTMNYAAATDFLWEGERIVGAKIADLHDAASQPISVKAKVVINATGPWCDTIRQMAQDAPILYTTKGVHIVLDATRLAPKHALVMKEHKRVVFCIPWGTRTVIGTTDTHYQGRPEDVHADTSDVNYLLDIANSYYPTAKLTPEDVISTWAGLRPLIKPDEAVSESDVSREDEILSRPGLITIAGGKLTTYRRMAIEVLDHVAEQIGPLKPSTTDKRPLPGAKESASGTWQQKLNQLPDAACQEVLYQRYGAGRLPLLIDEAAGEPDGLSPIFPGEPYLWGEIGFCARHEQVQTLDDLMSRRLAILLRIKGQGLSAIDKIAARLAVALGWSSEETSQQIQAYKEVAARTMAFSTPSANSTRAEPASAQPNIAQHQK